MRLIVLVIVILTMGIGHAEVYKYINKQGKTAYSDIPIQGAKKVIVPPVMTYKAPATQNLSSTQQPLVAAVNYHRLEITSPMDEATIRSNQGKLSVNYLIDPKLKNGDRVLLLLDGVRQESMNIEGLVRGQYGLSLEVVSANDELKMSSKTITIYLHHASKLN